MDQEALLAFSLRPSRLCPSVFHLSSAASFWYKVVNCAVLIASGRNTIPPSCCFASWATVMAASTESFMS